MEVTVMYVDGDHQLLWRDDGNLEDAVRDGSARYEEKIGFPPAGCLINKKLAEKTIIVHGIPCIPNQYMMEKHYLFVRRVE
jgi:hypothetical protein